MSKSYKVCPNCKCGVRSVYHQRKCLGRRGKEVKRQSRSSVSRGRFSPWSYAGGSAARVSIPLPSAGYAGSGANGDYYNNSTPAPSAEIAIARWLDEFCVVYERERKFECRHANYYADFICPDFMLIVEVDGDMAHTPNHPLHGRDTHATDTAKARTFQHAGFRVLRLSESSIKSGAAHAALDIALHSSHSSER